MSPVPVLSPPRFGVNLGLTRGVNVGVILELGGSEVVEADRRSA